MTPDTTLVMPVTLVAKDIPGDCPPAIRMRLAAKKLKRKHGVNIHAWLSRDQLAALKADCEPYDLDTLEPVADVAPEPQQEANK